MIESNLSGAISPIPEDLSKLKVRCSVTDPCVDWSTTEKMIRRRRRTARYRGLRSLKSRSAADWVSPIRW